MAQNAVDDAPSQWLGPLRVPRRRISRWRKRVTARWRRSLQMRVVATTLVASAMVVGVMGYLVVAGIRAGLLAHKVEAAVGLARATTVELQDRVSAAVDSTDEDQRLGSAVFTVGSRAQSPGGFYLRVANATGSRAYDYPPDIDLTRALQPVTTAPVQKAGALAISPLRLTLWTTIDDNPDLPGLLITDFFQTNQGTYRVYYVFPMGYEVRNLNLVQVWVWATESALVLLLALIAWIVTRQVVTPVRMAARTAERLSAGRLHERMNVKGQDDLARLGSSFNKMAVNLQHQIGQLEELSRVQRRFVSDVSHELRTPLTTVRMASELLHASRAAFEPDVARSAELLQRELDRFEALLVDLLEISRYDAGAAVLDAEAVNILAVVQRTVDQCSGLAERKQTPLLLQVPGVPVVAEVEGRRIERIMRNLIVNAIEHGDGGPVEITLVATEDVVAITVRDYGVGMSPESVVHVFERFWRADPARSRTTGGTGLGLSIALEDAHLHGGWLQAWGSPGAGANFRLTLPRRTGGELHDSPLPLEPPISEAPDPTMAAPPMLAILPVPTAPTAPVVPAVPAPPAPPAASAVTGGTATTAAPAPARRVTRAARVRAAAVAAAAPALFGDEQSDGAPGEGSGAAPDDRGPDSVRSGDGARHGERR
ncbi:MAG: two-component system, OmpR family, sensor histidine kinase MtrB [Frankiaceae bacterium]|nr:two-component system, OmpR family, sensor histidine kinase MtrB [Frankiaceae bacterium]